jgi:N-acetyl-gamma-glutamyl-phosphate reductase common form
MRAVVIGATGPTGGELIRLLLGHADINEIVATSRTTGLIENHHPNLRGSQIDLKETDEVVRRLGVGDVAFLCAPTGTAMMIAPSLLRDGALVIDLSADFRFRDAEAFEAAHGLAHTATDLLPAVYGLPECYGPEIRHARLVGNAGCYAAAVLLALIPLHRGRLVDLGAGFTVHATNGTTGADLTSSHMAHPHVFGNVVTYGLDGHRHVPEILEQLDLSENPGCLNMSTAHGAFARGIVAQINVRPAGHVDRAGILACWSEFYHRTGSAYEAVRIVDLPRDAPLNEKDYERYPQPGHVLGSNFCHLAAEIDRFTGDVKLVSVIDNLGKGAAGNAIQSMNLMLGFSEDAGISSYGL